MKQAYDCGINFFDTAERWGSILIALGLGVCSLRRSDKFIVMEEANPR